VHMARVGDKRRACRVLFEISGTGDHLEELVSYLATFFWVKGPAADATDAPHP
jgi:hypothetical protein